MTGGAVALVLVTAAVFGRALAGEFVYDDLTLIVGNPALVAPEGVFGLLAEPLWPGFSYWRPLTAALLWAGYHVGGGGAAAIHAAALVLHMGAGLVLLDLLRGPLGHRSALLAALLFAVHPAHAESVGWAAAVNDPLCGLLGLLGLRAAVRWSDAGSGGVPWRVVGWLGLALLAKETAVVLVPLLFLWPRWLAAARAGSGRSAQLRLLAAAAATLAAYLGLRLLVFADPSAAFGGGNTTVECEPLRAATVPLEVFGRLAAALVWPFAPSAFRPVRLEGLTGGVVVGAAAAGLWLLGWWLAGRRRWPLVRLGLVTFLVAVLPYLLSARSLEGYPVADRYLYLPAAALALGLVGLVGRAPAGRMVLGGIAAAWAVQTVLALGVWRDQESFASYHAARHDDDARVLYTAALVDIAAYETAHDPARLGAAEQTLALAAGRVDRRGWVSRRANERLAADIGSARAFCSYYREAMRERPDWRRPLQEFLDLASRYPELEHAEVGVGICYARLGAHAAAERAFRRALQLHPGLPAAVQNLELLRRQRGG